MISTVDLYAGASVDADSTTSHFFLSYGWGNPQGNRFEIGQNVGQNIIVGGTFVINDTWSNDHSSVRTGVILGSRFGPSDWELRPFVLASVGESWGLFTKSEYYAFVHLGFKVPSKSIVHIRPEGGLDITSKNDGTGSTKKETWFGFNLSIELEIF